MSLGICAVCGYEKGIGECELCALRSKVNQLGKELYEEHHRFLAENKKRVYLFDRLNEVAGENANLRAQLTAAEEVLWYQHCAIECASSATSCGSCGQCSAVKEAKQKFESYRNTYGKGEVE